MKKDGILCILVFSILWAGCYQKPTKGIIRNQIYLDYIFYKSLIYAYKNDSTFSKDATSGVYMDLSGFSILNELGDYLDREAKRRSEAIEPIEILDYEGKKSIFKELLDDYNNKKLNRKILLDIKNINN